MFNLGPFLTTRAALYITGVPLGSFGQRKDLKEVSW